MPARDPLARTGLNRLDALALPSSYGHHELYDPVAPMYVCTSTAICVRPGGALAQHCVVQRPARVDSRPVLPDVVPEPRAIAVPSCTVD